MADITQIGNEEKPLGMSYVYVLFGGYGITPYALGYAASLIFSDFESWEITNIILMVIAFIWIEISFLYFILILMKLAIVIDPEIGKSTELGQKNQIVKWNVPILGPFKKLKIIVIPLNRVKTVRILLRIVEIQAIAYTAYIIGLLIVNMT